MEEEVMRMKKFISILLAIVLVFSAVSVIAFAGTDTLYRDGNFEYYIYEDGAYIVNILGTNSGAVVIPSRVSSDPESIVSGSVSRAKGLDNDDNDAPDPFGGSYVYVRGFLNGSFDNVTEEVTSVSIPYSITSMDVKELGCPNLKTITVDDKNTVYSSLNGSLYNADKTTFILHPQASTDSTIADSVTAIEIGAFKDSTAITSVVIPDSLTVISDECFMGCTALRDVNFASSNITEIGVRAFANTALTGVEFGNSIQTIGGFAFLNSGAISSLVIPETAPEVHLCSGAFMGCPILNVTLYRNVVFGDGGEDTGDHAIGFYFDGVNLEKYNTTITGYKYSEDKQNTTELFAYADENGFKFIPLDPIYTATITASSESVSNYNAEMYLYRSKTLKYTASSNNGVFVFHDVDPGEYSIYIKTQFGLFTRSTLKANVAGGTVEEYNFTTLKYAPVGDLNKDGVIDMSDVAILLQTGVYNQDAPDYDIDGSGTVDILDIGIVLNAANYGETADKVIASNTTPITPL